MSAGGNNVDTGYETFQTLASPRDLTTSVAIRYPKALRATMSTKDLSDLMDAASAKGLSKYSMMAPKLESDESLKEFATLAQLNRSTRDRFVTYDMFDVFNLAFPFDRTKIDSSDRLLRPSVDALQHYLSHDIETFARSNEWYATWGTDEHVRNLAVTTTFFRNNCTAPLWHKILETYDKFPPSQQGGPLIFKILTMVLVTDYESAAESIIEQLKSFKITSIPGENVSSAVSLIRSACSRLQDIQRLPSTIELILLNIYQTTSVPEFNALFKNASNQKTYASLGTDAVPSHGVFKPERQKLLADLCEEINVRADRAYTRLRSSWNVPASRKDGGAALKAGSSDAKAGEMPEYRVYTHKALLSSLCWNCGSKDHLLNKCPLPRNTPKIEANRKQFKLAKEQKGSSSPSGSSNRPSKWAPPRTEERNRRNIDGKPMIYDPTTKRWNRDTSASGMAAAAAPAPALASSGSSSDVEAALANITRQFGTTITALSAVAAQMKQE